MTGNGEKLKQDSVDMIDCQEKCAALLGSHSGCDGRTPNILLNNYLFPLIHIGTNVIAKDLKESTTKSFAERAWNACLQL